MSAGDAAATGAMRRVWRLAWPIIVSNVTVPLLGAVDTAVVGHLPQPHYLGAVAVGALIFSFLFSAFYFLRMGTTGLTAQATAPATRSRCARCWPAPWRWRSSSPFS